MTSKVAPESAGIHWPANECPGLEEGRFVEMHRVVPFAAVACPDDRRRRRVVRACHRLSTRPQWALARVAKVAAAADLNSAVPSWGVQVRILSRAPLRPRYPTQCPGDLYAYAVQPLGDPIGEGRTAEVYDLGDGRVLKLLREGLPVGWLEAEADKTASVRRAGAPAPGVHGPREVGLRVGYVFDKAPGKKLLARMKRSPQRIRKWGRLMARHPRQHPRLRVCRSSRCQGGARLEDRQGRGSAFDEKAAARDALTRLPDGSKVLHGDLHPDNVFLDGDTATVIDWVDACCGDPAADIARTMWLISPSVIPRDLVGRRPPSCWARQPETPTSTGSSRRLSGSRIDVKAWRLPVVAARLSEGIESEEKILVREVRRLIG